MIITKNIFFYEINANMN